MNTPAAGLDAFPVVIELPIQWGDHDAFGHVNNTVPLRWFESARIAYIERCGLGHWMEPGDVGPILASVQCHYRRQLHYPDSVLVGARMARLGRSSMHIAHGVFSKRHGQLAVDGESVVVLFDYQRQRPTRVPPETRALIEQIQGPLE